MDCLKNSTRSPAHCQGTVLNGDVRTRGVGVGEDWKKSNVQSEVHTIENVPCVKFETFSLMQTGVDLKDL